jgi:hypothetical protein
VDWFNNRRIHNEIGKIPPAARERGLLVSWVTSQMVAKVVLMELVVFRWTSARQGDLPLGSGSDSGPVGYV